ncbi:pyridoxamine 5'-phosphate oxidase family protein [Lacticaseibacillus suihuaensis]
MNQTFLDVLNREGPVTIITVNAAPAHVVNTWMSYVTLQDGELWIPAAGMHSIEADFPTDNRVTLTFGSKDITGTVGPGAGFHVHGRGRFVASGPAFDAKKAQFPWLTRLLIVTIDDVEQKI